MKQNVNINVSIPEELLLVLLENTDDFAFGQSSSLADMCEEDFIKFASKNGVSIFGDISSIKEDYKNA